MSYRVRIRHVVSSIAMKPYSLRFQSTSSGSTGSAMLQTVDALVDSSTESPPYPPEMLCIAPHGDIENVCVYVPHIVLGFGSPPSRNRNLPVKLAPLLGMASQVAPGVKRILPTIIGALLSALRAWS